MKTEGESVSFSGNKYGTLFLSFLLLLGAIWLTVVGLVAMAVIFFLVALVMIASFFVSLNNKIVITIDSRQIVLYPGHGELQIPHKQVINRSDIVIVEKKIRKGKAWAYYLVFLGENNVALGRISWEDIASSQRKKLLEYLKKEFNFYEEK
jgi:hypothetical protein